MLELKLHKPKYYIRCSQIINNAASMSLQNDAMPMMDKDALGDYHIYSLNSSHNLGSKENITLGCMVH